MRHVLHNGEPKRNILINLKSAAIISLLIVLPFALLESLNNTITRQNALGLLVLFGLLWLLPTAFIVILVPILRGMRAGQGVMANPINLMFRAAFLALIAMTWGGILIDQFPCFI